MGRLVLLICYINCKHHLQIIIISITINSIILILISLTGLPDLTCEQAFELSDASAERSAAGCTIKLNKVSSDDEDVDDDGNDDADDSDNIVDADDDDSEGKSLTCKARVSLGLPVNTVFCCVVKGEVQQEPVKDESCLLLSSSLSSYHHDTQHHHHH